MYQAETWPTDERPTAGRHTRPLAARNVLRRCIDFNVPHAMRAQETVQRHSRNAEFLRGVAKTAAMTQQSEFDSLPFRSLPCLRQRHRRHFDILAELEITRADLAPFRHHDGAAHAIDQFAHITRPAIVMDSGNGIRCETAQTPARVLLEAVE